MKKKVWLEIEGREVVKQKKNNENRAVTSKTGNEHHTL